MQLLAISMVMAGQYQALHVHQQFEPGSTGCHAAGVQFSHSPDGPWETAGPGEDERPSHPAAVTAPAVPFDDANADWVLSGVRWHESAYVRVGIWPDLNLFGPPVHVSNAISPRVASGGVAPGD